MNYNWEDISHFEETEGKSITLKLYSEEGIESISIDLGSTTKCTELIHLLSTRTLKMVRKTISTILPFLVTESSYRVIKFMLLGELSEYYGCIYDF